MQAINYILLFIIFIFSNLGYGQVDSIKQEVFYENEGQPSLKEVYYVKKSAPNILHGIYYSYFQNGQLKLEGTYLNNTPKGIWRFYYESGKVKKEADRYNETDGYWKYFYENGNARMEGQFINNIREGDWIFYYEDESIKSEGKFLHGEKDGLWKYFDEDGVLQSECVYEAGIGSFKEYYSNGAVKRNGFIRESKGDSLWTEYYVSGEIKSTGMEVDGMKSGIWTFYHKNGEVEAKGSFYKGEQVGTWKYFNRTGNLISEGSHQDGYKSGLWHSYSINGSVISEGDYIDGVGEYVEFYEGTRNKKVVGVIDNGKYIGDWKFFSETGLLQRECKFENNIGQCTGFYPDGNKQIEGVMKEGEEIGTWTHYDKKGRVDGYKKYSGLDVDPEEYDADTIPKPKFSLSEFFGEEKNDTTTLNGPTYVSNVKHKTRHERKFQWWNKWKNIERKGLILGTNPLAILNGQIPISLEYYIESRLGHEIGYTYIWDPFLLPQKKLELNQLLITGNDFFFRQKFYFEQNGPGPSTAQRSFTVLGYFGHEFRYTREIYDFNVVDTLGNVNHFNANSKKMEWNPMLGARVLQNPSYSGWSFDVVFGVGVGYRVYTENFESTEETNTILNTFRRTGMTVPIRVGFSFGYLF